ncbi:unnamed protein product [Caenorhabditis bovis]|uniref:Uncharacterized protein n=1 Tax=Caenorhabditis bovis TaxID=2654633 RepID=A0A8S1EBJ2_9PELO|nr:unnamed protein product [Caenorhabditis bovis]
MGLTPVLLVVFLLANVVSANIYSCGGFVRSSGSSQVDYSRITVKLLNAEGNLKHEEEVNPSNGYFMIPVYNKGQYSLKVSSPDGYYFEPSVFNFKLDGVNDVCSKNEDIIFNLSGFSIRGVVDGAGAGLRLVLRQNGNEIDNAVTNDGGKYELKAPSGTYEVSTGKGSTECISRGKATVVVSGAPVDVTPNLKVSGYQLNIHTKTSTGKNFGYVRIHVFAEKPIDLPNVLCKKIDTFESVPRSHPYACDMGTTDSQGKLSIPCVPAGQYYAEASFEKKNEFSVKFTPNAHKVTISKSAENLKFVAESVSTQVQVTNNARILSGVDVVVDGTIVAKTDKNGFALLTGLKDETTVTITASAKNTQFSKGSVNVNLPNIKVSNIQVEKFEICGSVEKSENGIIEKLQFIKTKDNKKVDVVPKTDGSFCYAVTPGIYTIKPSDTTSSLTPQSLDVNVSEKPVTGLQFTHFKTDANIRVSCIGACPLAKVSLYLSGNNLIRTVEGTDVFDIKNIGPGNYQVKLDDGGRGCWEHKELPLVISQSKNVPSVHFVQSGFNTKLSISHDANIKWASVDNKQLHGTAKTSGGEVFICLPTSGRFTFTLSSCYKFENQHFDINVPYEGVHSERAIAARLGGIVDLEGDKTSATLMKIKSNAGDKEVSVSSEGKFVFDEPLTSVGEKVKFIPSSNKRLFEPTSKTITFSGKCDENVVQFKSFRGIFIDGTIRPAVQGAKIEAVLKSDKSVVISANSDKNGNYKIGPVKRVEDYEISAKLDGYRFNPKGSSGNFESVKLSQLNIKVVDEATDEPLEDVLLSLVGGKGLDYRSNTNLDSTAQKNFVALAPGEYFVRAILQEYKFSPTTSTIEVKEGVHENVVLKGKRVAYSVFGKMREMSGTPVPNIVIEALSSECDQHQSEAVTDNSGYFRLRGLHPNCNYKVYAKSDADGLTAPHSFPRQFTIAMTASDVKGLEFIATPIEKTTDMALEIDLSAVKDIQSVKVIVNRGHDHIQTTSVQLPQHLFYMSHLPRDGAEYSIRVEPEKPHHAFVAKTVFFTADVPIRVIRVPLTSQKKSGEVEISVGSLFAPVFFICIALLVFNQDRVFEVIHSFINSLRQSTEHQKKRK